MALTRDQAVHTYSSTHNGETYLFDVVLDSRGQVSVRNLRTAYGLITDSLSSLPDRVVGDIAEARGVMAQQLVARELASGTLTFEGDTAVEVALASGLLNNTNYRVVYTPPDSTPIRTEDKTETGFTATVASAYGSPGTPVEVDYVVLTSAQQSSVMSGTLTFVPADNGLVTVNFPSAMATTAYRVVLTPNGFFTARVSTRTKTRMVVQLGYTLGVGESVTVGYDVFV